MVISSPSVPVCSLENILNRESVLVTPEIKEFLARIATLDQKGLREFCFYMNSIHQPDECYSDEDLRSLYAGKLTAGIYFEGSGCDGDRERAIFSYYDAAKWAVALSKDSDSQFLWALRASVCSKRRARLCDKIKERVGAFYSYVYAAKSISIVLRAVMSGNFDCLDYGWPRGKLLQVFQECIDRATELKNEVKIDDDRIFGNYRTVVGYFGRIISMDGSLRPGFVDISNLDRVLRVARGDEQGLFIPEVDDCIRDIDFTQPFGIANFDMKTRISEKKEGEKNRDELRVNYARRLIAAIVFGSHASAGTYFVNLRDAYYAYEKAASASRCLVNADPDEAGFWMLRNMVLRSRSVGFSKKVGRFSDTMFSYLSSLDSCVDLIDRVNDGLCLPGWDKNKLSRVLRDNFYDMQDLARAYEVIPFNNFYKRVVAKVKDKHNL